MERRFLFISAWVAFKEKVPLEKWRKRKSLAKKSRVAIDT
jgi:hypothetical protein